MSTSTSGHYWLGTEGYTAEEIEADIREYPELAETPELSVSPVTQSAVTGSVTALRIVGETADEKPPRFTFHYGSMGTFGPVIVTNTANGRTAEIPYRHYLAALKLLADLFGGEN